MIIKENEYQGLQDFDVLIEDNNRDSDYFNVTEFPDTRQKVIQVFCNQVFDEGFPSGVRQFYLQLVYYL